jgi:hypothetical protein
VALSTSISVMESSSLLMTYLTPFSYLIVIFSADSRQRSEPREIECFPYPDFSLYVCQSCMVSHSSSILHQRNTRHNEAWESQPLPSIRRSLLVKRGQEGTH